MAIPASLLVGGVLFRFHGFTPVSTVFLAGRAAITWTFGRNTKTLKNTIFALLAAGTLTPAVVVLLDRSFRLSGRLMNRLDWLIVVLPFCVLGLVIWMIRYRGDETRRNFGIASIIVAVISIFASAPTVIK